jgi:hypothetical protein
LRSGAADLAGTAEKGGCRRGSDQELTAGNHERVSLRIAQAVSVAAEALGGSRLIQGIGQLEAMASQPTVTFCSAE